MEEDKKKWMENQDKDNADEQEPDQPQEDEFLDDIEGFSKLADIKLPEGFEQEEFLERFNHANFRVPSDNMQAKQRHKPAYLKRMSCAAAVVYLLLYIGTLTHFSFAGDSRFYYQFEKESDQDILILKSEYSRSDWKNNISSEVEQMEFKPI